ncbi:hypothetical protein Ahy_B07g086526 [Arachis hypogaea]|uniref:Uncharacterized protein n=1 Tax=Arachis hypogaea TaxID=3818 RepID=A0A444YA01_ARAHY|nr:hypothetical protein Ahy_B07g086526 [Arachis hypogaea]
MQRPSHQILHAQRNYFAVQSFWIKASSMELSTLEGGSNSTLINSNEGNEELSVGEVVIQERSKMFFKLSYLEKSDEDLLAEDYDEYDVNNNNNKILLPPHEFIARRLARSQISAFSVLEDVGRTLKVIDLSKVRNAVVTKTDFFKSL